jgi:hypothetical protein
MAHFIDCCTRCRQFRASQLHDPARQPVFSQQSARPPFAVAARTRGGFSFVSGPRRPTGCAGRPCSTASRRACGCACVHHVPGTPTAKHSASIAAERRHDWQGSGMAGCRTGARRAESSEASPRDCARQHGRKAHARVHLVGCHRGRVLVLRQEPGVDEMLHDGALAQHLQACRTSAHPPSTVLALLKCPLHRRAIIGD